MTGKRLVQAVTAAVLSFVMIFSASVGTVPASATSLSDLQQNQSNLKKQQKALDSRLASLKNDKSQKTAYKETLDDKISGLEDMIANEQKQIKMLDAQIIQKQNDIAGKQKKVDEDFAKLKDRVRALYMTGEASNLEIILNAKNIMDLADKSEVLKVIAEHDNALMDELKSDIDSIKAQKAAIDSERTTVVGKKTELEGNKKQLAQQSAEIAQVIAQINADQKQTEADKAKNADAEKAASAAIDKWFADYRAAHQRHGGGIKGTGNYMWPVPGFYQISSPYGWRWNHSEFHKGIDIAGGGIYGAEIVAADAGTVAFSGDQEVHGAYGGYGNVVVIDHGNGTMTLYGHMSRRAVGTGDNVSKGDVIGYAGASGQATGPHCHFEIRVDGSAQDPMGYFSR